MSEETHHPFNLVWEANTQEFLSRETLVLVADVLLRWSGETCWQGVDDDRIPSDPGEGSHRYRSRIPRGLSHQTGSRQPSQGRTAAAVRLSPLLKFDWQDMGGKCNSLDRMVWQHSVVLPGSHYMVCSEMEQGYCGGRNDVRQAARGPAAKDESLHVFFPGALPSDPASHMAFEGSMDTAVVTSPPRTVCREELDFSDVVDAAAAADSPRTVSPAEMGYFPRPSEIVWSTKSPGKRLGWNRH